MNPIPPPMDSSRSGVLARIQEAIAGHPPMPAFYSDLIPHVQDPDVSYEELSKIIRNDPGVTMNILRMANTAYFSGPEKIDSLQQALVRLGSRRLLQIVIAHGVSAQLAGRLDGYSLAPRGLLMHSVGVAVTAERLAHLLGLKTREMLFTAGLLHDMGKVILDPFVKEYRERFEERLAQDPARTFDDIEGEVLGITHPEAGSQLMARWNFPDDVVEIVACHHHPERSTVFPSETLMVHLADTLLYSQGIGDGIDGFRYSVANDAAARLGLRSRDVEQVASGALDQLRELEAMM